MINNELKNTLRFEAVEAEQIGKLTTSQLAIIYKNKWFHLLVPRAYGGMEMDLPSFARFMEELARIDGAFAWNVNLGAGANMFAGYMDPTLAKELFTDARMCIAGSGAQSGTAQKTGNDFVINGTWKYASGSAHATYFSSNAITDHDSSFSSFIVPSEKVQVHSTWKTTGLKATASHDFSVKNEKISKSFRFSLLNPSLQNDGPLYHFPFQVLADINMLVMTTGLTIRFLELSEAIINEKKVKGSILGDQTDFNKKLKCFSNAFNKTREDVFFELDNLWSKAQKKDAMFLEEEEQFTQIVVVCAEKGRELVDFLYPYLGMQIVFETSEINRVWRDLKTASQHSLLSPHHMLSFDS